MLQYVSKLGSCQSMSEGGVHQIGGLHGLITHKQQWGSQFWADLAI